MQIQNVHFSKVKPAPYNPRKDLQPEDSEYKKLEKSIEEFGLVQLLVWNKRTGNLVGGHQTLKILKDREKEEAQMSVVDLPLKKEKALNLALNKIEGDWDNDKLAELIEELDNQTDIDLIIAGFDSKEIDDLITEIEAENNINYFNDLLDEAEKEVEDYDDEEEEEESKKNNQRLNPKMDLSSLAPKERGRVKEKKARDLKKRAKEKLEDNENVEEGSGKHNQEEKAHFVQFSITLKKEERKIINEIINLVKEKYNKETSVKAMLKICEIVKGKLEMREENEQRE